MCPVVVVPSRPLAYGRKQSRSHVCTYTDVEEFKSHLSHAFCLLNNRVQYRAQGVKLDHVAGHLGSSRRTTCLHSENISEYQKDQSSGTSFASCTGMSHANVLSKRYGIKR